MECSYKMRVNAPKEHIWAYYADISKWYAWEEDLEDISLQGDFVTGTKGSMKLAGLPPLSFTLTEVVENRIFCDTTSTPLGDVHFTHEILEEADGLSIRHSVSLETAEITMEKLGFLKQIFADVPDSVMLLKTQVE